MAATATATANSKILVIGGTGFIGKFVVEASVKAGHPTFVLVRESTLSDPTKSSILQKFKTLGDLHDHQILVKAIKQVDVVISTVGHMQILDQYKIISAIKEVGNIKFGNDVDRTHAVNEAKKAQIRRTIEAQGIPHIYVVSNFFARHFLPTWSKLGAIDSSINTVIILGDGEPKAIFNMEEDIATYTIRTVDDPTTLNKILCGRRKLVRVYVPEEQVLKHKKDIFEQERKTKT